MSQVLLLALAVPGDSAKPNYSRVPFSLDDSSMPLFVSARKRRPTAVFPVRHAPPAVNSSNLTGG